jgi:hypothetical protein
MGGSVTEKEKKQEPAASEINMNDINSPGGPPRMPVPKKSPFIMPVVEE